MQKRRIFGESDITQGLPIFHSKIKREIERERERGKSEREKEDKEREERVRERKKTKREISKYNHKSVTKKCDIT